MIRHRAIASFASLLFAVALTVSVAHAQTGSGTTNDPNTTNQTQTDQYNTQQTTPTDQTAGTTTSPNAGYPATTDYDRDRGPDLGWLGLLGLVGLLGLRRRHVHHGREDEVRGGRPATV